jgi:hypothetical protein
MADEVALISRANTLVLPGQYPFHLHHFAGRLFLAVFVWISFSNEPLKLLFLSVVLQCTPFLCAEFPSTNLPLC